jgi:rod shape-determining protein MreD
MMLVRFTALALLLVTAALLESTVFAALAIAGHTPSIVTLTVVGVALADGAESGGTYGFASGLFVDLLGTGLVGPTALVLLLVGFATGLLRPYLTGPPVMVHVVSGGLAVTAASALLGLLLFLLDPADLTMRALVEGTLVTGLYSAALAPFVVRPAMALCRRVETATVAMR